MRTSQRPLPSITPTLLHGQYPMRYRCRHPRKQHTYPKPHPRYAPDEDLMRTIDKRFDSESISNFRSSLDPIVEEDESAINLHAAIIPPNEGDRIGGRLRRVSLTTVVVDLAFVIRRKFQRVRTGNNTKTPVVFEMLT